MMPSMSMTLPRYLAAAVFSLSMASAGVARAAPHPCAQDAVAQALKLLKFHVDGDTRAEVDDDVKVLHPFKNPANPKQKFDVLEVWGSVYKGQYRMHLIYAQMPGQCVLMGQEILEHASL